MHRTRTRLAAAKSFPKQPLGTLGNALISAIASRFESSAPDGVERA